MTYVLRNRNFRESSDLTTQNICGACREEANFSKTRFHTVRPYVRPDTTNTEATEKLFSSC